MLGARRHVHTLAEGGCFVRVCVCWMGLSMVSEPAIGTTIESSEAKIFFTVPCGLCGRIVVEGFAFN